MFKKWFYNDYNDYYIVEEINKNVCGKEISTYYKLKYKKCRFGIKYYSYFKEHIWGMGDSYYSTYCLKDKQELIDKYKGCVVFKQVNIIKENICESILPLNKSL